MPITKAKLWKDKGGTLFTNDDVEISGTLHTDGADNILLPRLNGPTLNSIEDMLTINHSTGHFSGGLITIPGGGVIDVSAGSGSIRAVNDGGSQLFSFEWAASSSIVVPTGSVCYVGVQYEGGNPIVVARIEDDWNYQTDFPLGRAVNSDGVIHKMDNPLGVADHGSLMAQRTYQVAPLSRDNRVGGLILASQGANRFITVSEGALWDRLNRFPIDAIDTSIASTFDSYYQDGVGGFTVITGSTEWNNTQYDDGTGTLAALNNNRYTNRWFYVEPDGDLVSMFGLGEYTSLALAEAEAAPTAVPLRISALAKLVGRFIVQESSVGPPAQVDSAFTVVLVGGAVSDHGNLSGLSDDDHPQYTLVTAFTPVSSALESHRDDTTIHFTSASIPHGDLASLDGDDHLQYIHVSGTRAFAGNISHGGFDITNVGIISASQITGSHREVTSGIPFLVGAGTVNVSYATNGQVTISGSSAVAGSGSLAITQHTSSIGTVSTTSATFIQLPGMFITSSAGDHLVFFRCSMRGNNNQGEVALYVDGTEYSTNNRSLMIAGAGTAAGMFYDVGMQRQITVSAGQIVQVFYRKQAGPNTVDVSYRDLSILAITP